MQSGSKISRKKLETMLKQGLDKDGQPKTSYWKARIDAEAGRVRVAELEAELEALRAGQSAAPVAAPAPAAPPAPAKLERELKDARERIASLEKQLKTRSAQGAPAASLPAVPESGDQRVRALERELREFEEQKQRSQQKLMTRIREFQEANGNLQKEVREALKSKDHWQEKAQALETVLADVREQRANPTSSDVTAVGHYPSVQNLLEWLGVRIEEGRVIAVGEAHRNRIQIEIRKDKLARVLQLDQGKDRTYQTLDLTAPAHELLSIVLPCQRYYEHRTDPRVLDACKLLGRPLPTN